MNTLTASLFSSEAIKYGSLLPSEAWRRHMERWRGMAGRELLSGDLVLIPDKCIDEFDHALSVGLGVEADRAELIAAMPRCAALAESMRAELLDGAGFVVLDRFPVKRYSVDQNRQLAGLVGNLIAPLMAQDRHGTFLYDVLDDGPNSNAVRRSKTNWEQPFHTDGGWLQPPPAFIGLFCIQPAMSGGSSQLASLPVALTRLADQGVDVSRLREPLYWNRMAEHAAGDLPYSYLPVLEAQSPAICFRYYVDYVKTGYALAGHNAMPREIAVLFEQIDQALADTAIQPFSLRAGQLQYVNNWLLVHARGRFDDSQIGDRGRHLVRIWNRHS